MTKFREIKVEITAVVRLRVPDTMPAPDKLIQDHLEWLANRFSDGRYPFCAELMSEGAATLAARGLEEAVFRKVCDLPRYRHNRRVVERNHRVSRALAGRTVRFETITAQVSNWTLADEN